ncbi:MAG: DUF1080 domain-containing protein [Planctomycetaceae bacterium]|nr:DUF1080 domain-containing protein [Planctomycetaceae bacterium]
MKYPALKNPVIFSFIFCFIFGVSFAAETVDNKTVQKDDKYAWQKMFNGKDLKDWTVPVFGGDGEVAVKDGGIVLGQGAMATGIKYEKVFPKLDYEICYEAKRTMGSDFFAALTFPVGDSFCTFINGGWGGGTTGLSCVDHMDASENETSTAFSFRDNDWYKFRVQVTGKFIKVWITETKKDKTEEKLVIDLETKDKTISLRDETTLYKPLGICTWVSEGVLRNIEYRHLKPEEVK